MQIVDTAPFQRLRRVHQLAMTHLVYPGAEHNRFAHSLGVLELATRVFDHLFPPYTELLRKEERVQLRQVIRLYALLHDVGHGPFSHAGDGLFPPKTDHETYAKRIIMETDIASVIADIGNDIAGVHGADFGISPAMIGDVISGGPTDPLFYIIKQVMSSEVDVDKMDYLLRDSLNCGVNYGRYDLERLRMSLRSVPVGGGGKGYRLAVDLGGINAFESFILARYWMFLQVYFHRTRRVYDYFLQKFIPSVLPSGLPENVWDFLEWDDYRLWDQIVHSASKNVWAGAMVKRGVWKVVFESPSHAERHDDVEFQLLSGVLEKAFDKDCFFIDHASKAPHRLAASFDPEDEKAIILVDRQGTCRDMYRESEIIHRIVEPISKYRVYASPDCCAQVAVACDEHHARASRKIG